MSINAAGPGGQFAAYTAEIYDISKDYVDDIALIRELPAGSADLGTPVIS